MAYIKTTWVNDETELDAENMNHIEEGIEKSYAVWLVAVTDEEPEECYAGDLYFNTETKKLYEAIERNVWSETGFLPEVGVIYIVFETKTTYSYDGDTLISVGGGGGGGIAVAPDEPSEDTKLYIESTDLDFQGLEISDEYTTGDNVAYSADYSNSAFGGTILWTNSNPTSSFASQNITLSSDNYDMYEIIYKSYNNQTIATNTGKIPKEMGTTLLFNAGNSTNGPYVYRRDIAYTNATTLAAGTATEAYASTNAANNNMCVPLYVIGYKTGLFS